MPSIQGVIAPIVTPFSLTSGEIDYAWISRHLAYLREYGCEGVVACGTNGEAASMSVAERMRVLETVLGASGSLHVLAGTGASALPDAIELTRHAFSVGVEAVLVMPPFYFKRPPESGTAGWFQRLIDAAVPAGGHVLLYHIPQTTMVPFTDTLLSALLASHGEVIVGIKDSTGDASQGEHIRQMFPQLAYFVGNDHLVGAACSDSGIGSITAGANVFPDLVHRVQREARTAGDVEAAQATLSAARRLLESFPLQAATKAALVHAGLPATAVRPPQPELSAAQWGELRNALDANVARWRSVAAVIG